MSVQREFRRLSFPPNPRFGTGATRRRIDLLNEGSRTIARVIDPFHEMDCEIVHDGERVTDASGVMHRYPTTLCPGATTVIRGLVGEPIRGAAAKYYAPEVQVRHCTHLLDLAWLAVIHAARPEARRVYDAHVPDPKDAPVVAQLQRNGELVCAWTVERGVVTGPDEVAGLPLLAGFWTQAFARFAGDALEEAVVLARAHLIAIGRAYDTQAWAGRPIADNVALRDRCFAYASAHGDAGRFVHGYVRDFTDELIEKT